jgi:hypothetical protein
MPIVRCDAGMNLYHDAELDIKTRNVSVSAILF